MPGHSQPDGYRRTLPSSTAFSRAPHVRTYTTRRMSPGALPTHDDMPGAACPDIHNLTDATGVRSPPQQSHESRMPGHIQHAYASSCQPVTPKPRPDVTSSRQPLRQGKEKAPPKRGLSCELLACCARGFTGATTCAGDESYAAVCGASSCSSACGAS